jgi:HK97 family phage portal protein
MTFTVMNFWQKLLTLFSPSRFGAAWHQFTGQYPASPGSSTTVNSTTALSIAAAGACVKVLAETMAALPLSVYYQDGETTRVDNTHECHYLLHDSPHPFYTSFSWREAMMYDLNCEGNGLSVIIRNGLGEIQSIQHVPWTMVRPVIYENKLFYDVASMDRAFPSEDVIHIPLNTRNGIIGVSPIEQYAQTLGENLDMLQHSSSFYKNGVIGSGVLESEKGLSKDAGKRLRESFMEQYGGVKNRHKPIVLEEGMKWKPTAISQKDSDYILNRKLGIEDISRIYRMPLDKINILDRATFSNIEQMTINFIQDTMLPWVKRWEMELNKKLFTKKQRVNYYVRFNLEGLLRGDSQARAQFYKELWMIGAINQNEIRKNENLNPIAGGDTYYRPLNMIDSSITPEQEASMRNALFPIKFKAHANGSNGHSKEAAERV